MTDPHWKKLFQLRALCDGLAQANMTGMSGEIEILRRCQTSLDEALAQSLDVKAQREK